MWMFPVVFLLNLLISTYPVSIGGSKESGAWPPPPKAWQKCKNGPISSIWHYFKKKLQGGMPPDPPNSLICPVFWRSPLLAPGNPNVWSRLCQYLNWKCFAIHNMWLSLKWCSVLTLVQWFIGSFMGFFFGWSCYAIAHASVHCWRIKVHQRCYI